MRLSLCIFCGFGTGFILWSIGMRTDEWQFWYVNLWTNVVLQLAFELGRNAEKRGIA